MSNISIGQELRVRLNEEVDDYKSRLIEDTPTDYLIEIPLHSVDNRSLLPGEAGLFWVEFHAADGAICRFQSGFEGITYVPIPAWRIRRPTADQISREQRREFVRVQAVLPVRLSLSDDTGPVRQVDVYTRDISGGGMAVLIPRSFPIETGSSVHAKFTLPHNQFPVDVKCEVTRVAELTNNELLLVSLRFESLKDAIQQRIIQFTFQRQRVADR